MPRQDLIHARSILRIDLVNRLTHCGTGNGPHGRTNGSARKRIVVGFPNRRANARPQQAAQGPSATRVARELTAACHTASEDEETGGMDLKCR